MKPSLIPKRGTCYVPHPRYGSEPRYTGLDVQNLKNGAYIRAWTAAEWEAWCKKNSVYGIDIAHLGCLIPGTAIEASTSLQLARCIHITHYYDIEKKCRDCGQLFIFFAEEQKYWHEELQFPVEAECIRCFPCRKQSQKLDKLKARYDELSLMETRSVSDELEMTLARLDLVEAGIFNPRQIEKAREFLNKHEDHDQADAIRARLLSVTINAQKAKPIL